MEETSIDGRLNCNQKEIVNAILNHQRLLKYLFYEDNSLDIPHQDDLTSEQRRQVKNNHIYEYRKIPNNKTSDMNTYISMEFGNIYYSNGTGGRFNNEEFVFYVVTHNSLDSTKFNGSRLNAIESCLVDIFHCKLALPSVGKTEVTSSGQLFLPNDFIGRQIKIQFVDKNI